MDALKRKLHKYMREKIIDATINRFSWSRVEHFGKCSSDQLGLIPSFCTAMFLFQGNNLTNDAV